ncbi:hypothetical protein [Gordonia sihwensis]|uniref:hypothetical protein n=1 Tax=Gordonia sihwensis TaxID=173559 RepID=UPI0024177784|nr:hypothetical protein [Gordonia sihwensis]WFN93484.1 hypothetical protein P5P27_02610 [Gordonia sihwensis]
MSVYSDWYDDVPVDPSGLDGELFDPPVSPLDRSRIPSRTGGLPIDPDLAAILAGEDGLATKPDVVQLLDEVREFAVAVIKTFGGDTGALAAWIDEHAPGLSWLPDLTDWVFKLITNPGRALSELLSGVIPIGLLAPTTPNLLPNPAFDGAVSMVEGDGWAYDPDVGRTSPGSARYDCTGVAGMQLATPVQVAEGQKVAAEAWVRWAGVTAGSGTGIRLMYRWYSGETLVSTTQIAAVTDPVAVGGWSKLSAAAIPAPAGVDSVCLALVVDAGLAAGQVWFDDTSLTKPTASLPQQWISGLVDDLGQFWTMIEQFASIVAGGAVTAINGIVQDFKDGWTSTSNWIQDIINAILRAIRRVPVVGGTIADIIAEVGGLNDRTDQANQSVASVSSQVSFVADVIAVRSGVGVWESGPDPTGIVSFPYSMLMLHSHTTSVTGSTGTRDGASSSTGFTSAGGENHSHSVYSTSHSHDAGSLKVSVGMGVPTINATASWAPWASVRFPSSADRQVFTFLASKSGSVTSFFVDVYRLNANGSSSYVASSTDQSGNVGGALAWQQVILPAIPVEIGDVLEVQFRVAGSGTVQIAGINLPYPTPISGFRPYAPGSGRDPSGSATPAEIAIGVRDSMYQGPVPFVSVGIDLGQTAIPRYFYDDFNRGSLGPRWSTSGNIGVTGNRVQHRGGVLESGTATATYSQQLLTDNARVEFDLSAGSGIAGVGACCSSTLGSGLWFVVDSGSCSIQTGSAGSRTQRASGAGGDGRYVGTWTTSDTTARLYRNGELVASWVDSASVVPHGDGRRWCALIVSKPALLDSGRIDNWVAADVVPQ